MAVLLLTFETTTHTVDLREGHSLVLGAAPTADLTLQHVGWPDRIARVTLDGDGAWVEFIARELPRRRLDIGDRITLGRVGVALLAERPALPPDPDPALPFGSYDDDPLGRPSSSIADASFPVAPMEAGAPTDPTPATASAEPTPAPTVQVTREPAPQPVIRVTLPPAPMPPASMKQASMQPTSTPDSPTTTTPSDPQTASESRPLRRSRKKPAARVLAAASTIAPRDKPADAPDPITFPAPTLGEDMVQQLRRAPFFAASLAVHLLVAFLLAVVWRTDDTPSTQDGTTTIGSAILSEEEFDGESLNDDPVDDLPLDASELDTVDIEESLELPEEAPSAPTIPDSLEHELAEFMDGHVEPTEIGTIPTNDILQHRTNKRMPTRVPPKILAQQFSGGMAHQANRKAADIVRDMMGKGARRGGGKGLEGIKEGDLLVVQAGFDHIGKVLTALRLPYRTVQVYDLTAKDRVNFEDYQVVFWNCGESFRGMNRIHKRIAQFVRKGGYLFTTDWAIEHVVVPSFPGYLTTRGRNAKLEEMVVEIEPTYEHRNHPLLEGVFARNSNGRWWLEQLSFDVGIGPRGRETVTSLIESPPLADHYGVSPIVAATFPFGRGRVLHAMGHYFQEAGNLAGTIASHRLALNFVMMRLAQEGRR